ncbi:MAG: protein arginine kinase [Clostridiaceae bacterium]|nr:protein arginine kinase [Clostridiaceae bacterium]
MSKWYVDTGPDSDVVISSRVRLARNFNNYPFPHRSLPEHQEKVIRETCDALFSDNPKLKETFSLIRLHELTPIERQVLMEKHLISKELAESNLNAGALISKDEQVSIMLNEEDHLRIQCLATGMQLEKAFDICNYLDNVIADKIDYAYSNTIGYLTSCPTNVGTAIRVSVMLHLPALTMTGYIKPILESCGKLGLAVRGLYGENTEAYGNMFQLSNQVTLGKNENDIVMSVKNISYQIIEQERLLRIELLNKNNVKLVDRIMRSYGILRYAQSLSSDEALQRLSDIRLGINLGLIEDLTEKDLSIMFLMIQPGNLQQYEKRELGPEERDIARANYVRKYMQKGFNQDKEKMD